MKLTKFSTLPPRQQRTMLLAMQVRNALEDFHVANLTDAQMRTLNQTIRFGLYDALSVLDGRVDDPARADALRWWIESIPDYWEIPGSDDRPQIG